MILILSDHFLFFNRFLENLLDAFLVKTKRPFVSNQMKKALLAQESRKDLEKFNHYLKNKNSPDIEIPRIIKRGR